MTAQTNTPMPASAPSHRRSPAIGGGDTKAIVGAGATFEEGEAALAPREAAAPKRAGEAGGAPGGADAKEGAKVDEAEGPATPEMFIGAYAKAPGTLVALFKKKTSKDWKLRKKISKIDDALAAFIAAVPDKKVAALAALRGAIETWLGLKGDKDTERRPGVIALQDATRWFENDINATKAGAKADPSKREAYRGRLGVSEMKANLTFTMPEKKTGRDAVPLEVKVGLADEGQLASLPADFKSQSDDIIGSGLRISMVTQQPKHSDDPAFVPNMEIKQAIDFGDVSHAFKTAADGAAGKENVRVITRKKMQDSVVPMKRRLADDLGKLQKGRMLAGYKSAVDAELSPAAKKTGDDAYVAAKAGAARIGWDVKKGVSDIVDDARRGDSQTLSKGAKKAQGTANWKEADATVRQMVIDKIAMSVEALSGINATLEKNMGGKGGKIRDEMEYAGHAESITRFYLYPEYVRDELQRLLTWVNEAIAVEGFNPVTTAAKAHQWLVSIHPYADANGRTGKLLGDYILMRGGLPPAIIAKDTNMGVLGGTIVTGDVRPEEALDAAVKTIANGLASTVTKSGPA